MADKPPSPTPPASPGAADAPKSDDETLLSLLDAAPDEPDTPPEPPEGEEEPPKPPTDEEEGDEPEPEPEHLYEVRPDGKPEKVTLDEALKGYTRTATFHRRMQEVAEERKAFEAQRAAETAKVAQLRDEYAKRLEVMAKALDDGEAEPDWEKLRQERPDEYPQLWADWQRKETRRQKLAAERERVAEDQEREAAEREHAYLADQATRLREALPDLFDRTKGPALKAELVSMAEEEYGYRPEEVDAVKDHRALRLLHDAVQYRKLLAKKAALGRLSTGKPAALAPGASQPALPRSKAQREAYDRLKKTGSKEDAVETFLGMLDAEERSTARRR